MSPSLLQPVRWQKFEEFIVNECGCIFERQKGSHRVYKKPDLLRPIIIPAHSYEISVGVIRSNLRTLGVSTQDYAKYQQANQKKKRRR